MPEATLKLAPILPSSVGLLTCPTITDAAGIVAAIFKEGITLQCMELLDENLIRAVNQASLRKRLEDAPAPCLPFLGLYLTDLTFVDAGNPKTRELPGSASETGEPVTVINFDKYMRTARIISSLRRFQVPYKIQPKKKARLILS